jgi:hypothetical protein
MMLTAAAAVAGLGSVLAADILARYHNDAMMTSGATRCVMLQLLCTLGDQRMQH